MEQSFIFSNAWLIPALPLFSFIIIGLGLQFKSNKWSGRLGTLSTLLTGLCSYALAWDYFQQYPLGSEHPVLVPWEFIWLPYDELLKVKMGVLVDSLSIILMLVVTTVSFLVHLYSTEYMQGEKAYGRYYTFLSLFTFSMLGLVVAPNIVQTFVFWELVGASSFSLIGFYYQKPSAVSASKKAFIVTRFADLGFLIGIMFLGYYGYGVLQSGISAGLEKPQTFDFVFLTSPAMSEALLMGGYAWALPTSLILIFIGAAGKSAMFPLHIWLPDAMEGPTPVSALIHAATMVVAGVYLTARLFPLYSASESALLLIAIVGAFTALFAAVIACTQDDIKRVLAFSTLSQLGYMMLALGVATADSSLGYTAAIFHLWTHAFFKALLFLGAGAVIHAVHSNSIWDMGGLAKKMPITHISFLLAVLAISGLPPFAGFYSKDEILLATLTNGHEILFAIGFFVAGLTAFYMSRIYFVTFWGAAKSAAAEKAHDGSWAMTFPLVFLATLSICAGWLPFGKILSFGTLAENHHSWILPVAATAMALLGILASWLIYVKRGLIGGQEGRGLYKTIKNKFFIDELYLFITHKVIFRFIARPVAWFDRHVVDASMDMTAWLTCKSGSLLRLLQTGQVQTYAFAFSCGALLLILLIRFGV